MNLHLGAISQTINANCWKEKNNHLRWFHYDDDDRIRKWTLVGDGIIRSGYYGYTTGTDGMEEFIEEVCDSQCGDYDHYERNG